MQTDDHKPSEEQLLLIYARIIIQRFEKHHPGKHHCLTIENIAQRISDLNFCEITGLKFTRKKNIYPICINPFEERIIGANQIALVVRDYRTKYFKICNHISDNIGSPEMKSYIDSDMRFQLAKELSIKYLQSKTQSLEFGHHPHISELIQKSKIKNSKEIMLMNIKNPVVKNSIETSYQKFYSKEIKPFDEFSEDLVRHKIQRCIQKSHMKGLTSDITFENSTLLFHRHHCQLTGMRLKKLGHTKDTQSPNTFTIDRINRFEGYNISNMIVLCYAANQMKSKLEKFNYSEDIDNIIEFLETIKKQIYKTYKGKFEFKLKKALPVEKILENYIKSKNEPQKRCHFK